MGSRNVRNERRCASSAKLGRGWVERKWDGVGLAGASRGRDDG